MSIRVVLCALLAMAPALAFGADDPKPSAPPQQQEQPHPSGPSTAPDPNALAAPKAAPAADRSKMPAVDDKSYVFGAMDQLAIVVYRQESLSNKYLVRPDGKITMPLIGDIQASGKTQELLSEEIKEKLKTVGIKEPDVTVMLSEIGSKKYFIFGEVMRPGEYPLAVPTRVLEALVNSGGFKEFADQKNILINRNNGAKVLKFNYKDVSKGKKKEQNVYLEPGDVIVVN